MKLYPAIDLKDGKCVRLRQGDFNKKVIFNDNPIEQALKFQNEMAEYLHIVDLDGAIGNGNNREIIKKIVKNVTIPVQVGGGIKNEEDIRELLNMGVSRIIIGSLVVEDFELVKEMISKYQDKIVVSLDVKNDYIAIAGWKELSNITIDKMLNDLVVVGLKTLISTDISKDGMLSGIDVQNYKRIKDKYKIEVIASGGIKDSEDIIALRNEGIDGAIIGKALYLEKIDLLKLNKKIMEEK